jgi:processive 1,2-diacylglycerol beta-glucosyltransferase
VKRILFLPLLQMPSGHHQVANALIRSLHRRAPDIDCRKVDFLSYANEWLEKVVTGTYLKWIHHFPVTYDKAYRTFASSSSSDVVQHFQWYERFFVKKMQHLLEKEQPDLIVCTHGFPSSLINRLKMRKVLRTPVINVYTDFFINSIWGRHGIDYHFVADTELKIELMRSGVPEHRIYTTGIPVDDCFKRTRRFRKLQPPFRVLVSGGSNGLGHIKEILKKLKPSRDIRYDILCGNNRNLYNEIVSMRSENIQPLPYISSRDEMNQLYDSVDAVMTKAGGVTVSEALFKGLPVFVHASLPGQETFNRDYLESRGLIRHLKYDAPFDQQLLEVLTDEDELNEWRSRMEAYRLRLREKASDAVLQLLQNSNRMEKQNV